MPIAVDIDVMLARRKMSVGELAERVGITPANLAVLKNGRAKAVRFTTLAALCEVLDCQPGDLLRWEPGPEGEAEAAAGGGGAVGAAGPAGSAPAGAGAAGAVS
jgi:putative transcriptional regulator